MAVAIKALNAKIRANPVLDYVCSTRMSNNLLIHAPCLTLRVLREELVACYYDCRAGVSLTCCLCPDFWGPASNFGIPIAAFMDTQKDPEMCASPPSNSSFHFSGIHAQRPLCNMG